MNERERFNAVMSYQPYDRVPVWYFGTWPETRRRWEKEDGVKREDIPAATGMDPDWEAGRSSTGALANADPILDGQDVVLEETDDYKVVRRPHGEVTRWSKAGSTPPFHVEYPLKPTRKSWEVFKPLIDPTDPRRHPEGWAAAAEELRERDGVLCSGGGGLFGIPRHWLGDEELCVLPYEDPVLFEEILDHVTELFITVYTPVFERARPDMSQVHIVV